MIDVSEVLARANGRWAEILTAVGVDEGFLVNRHGPCPTCGGKKPFRFDDKGGEGTSYCTHCGARNGVQLLREVSGLEFIPAIREIARILGGDFERENVVRIAHPGVIRSAMTAEETEIARVRLIKAWRSSFSGQGAVEPVARYLGSRGLVLPALPEGLRFHPSLPFFDEDGKRIGRYPAMLAVVSRPDGKPVSMHRTYLDRQGRKLCVKGSDGEPLPAKRLMKATEPLSGSAIRLYEAGETLAVAEGIETALAVHVMTGLPVWAGISASILKKMVIPADVRRVEIFADHDLPDRDGRRAGQDAAAFLAERLVEEGREVVTHLPQVEGTDFLDEFNASRS